MSEHIEHRLRNICAQQQLGSGPIRCFMRESMHKYTRQKPRHQQAGNGKSRSRTAFEAARLNQAWLVNVLLTPC